jgi:cell division protein FtsQ
VRRALGWSLVAALLLGLFGAAVAAPDLLRDGESFRVQRVAVVGTRFLAPHEVLAVSRIHAGTSIFAEAETWRARLLEHPLVADARIERQFPGTVVLTVIEREPIAFTPAPDLRPVDAEGRMLPIDPADLSLDLPILGGPADGLARPDARARLAGAAARARRLEPAFAARISELHHAPDGAVLLALRSPIGAEALIAALPDAPTLRRLERALADLEARGELHRLRRIDARFRDQIVVTLFPDAAY